MNAAFLITELRCAIECLRGTRDLLRGELTHSWHSRQTVLFFFANLFKDNVVNGRSTGKSVFAFYITFFYFSCGALSFGACVRARVFVFVFVFESMQDCMRATMSALMRGFTHELSRGAAPVRTSCVQLFFSLNGAFGGNI